MELIDIGSNLMHESFAADRDLVISRACQAGVTRQIVTGADLASSQAAASLAASHPSQLWSTAGVHPHHAASVDSDWREQLVGLLHLPRTVAVGECGLDYFRNFSAPDAQRSAFVAQLEIAATVRKPVFLHQRDSHSDFVSILREFRSALVGGVAHCFTGDAAQLEEYVALGLYIGVTGWICDERRGSSLRAAAPLIPAERLLVETDAPYLLPRDLPDKPRSRRNEPANLKHIAGVIAGLRRVSVEEVAACSTRNALRLFGLS